MLSLLRKYWWSFALRGLFLMIFGIIAVTAPNMTSETLVLYLGFFMGAVGTVFVFVGLMIRKSAGNWYSFLLLALFDLFIAYYCIFKSDLAAFYFVRVIAVWALFMGISLFWIGFRLEKTQRIVLFINGILSTCFALLIYFNPLSMTSTNFMVGFYTILLSLFILYISYRLQRGSKKHTSGLATAAEQGTSYENK
jgi:uncharacterized membrane protein HdeD (DUF308 family)